MPQNIYDDPTFFEGYAKLPRSVGGLEAAPEWPALRALLPDMQDLSVLDLGCGYGWLCRWARQQGAARALGIDVSEKMLSRAAAETDDPAIVYQRADLDTVDLPREAFDVAYSSLALHYLEDLSGLIARVHDALLPEGIFVFSTEHPIYTAPSDPRWVAATDGRQTWPIDRYLDEGPRVTDWLAPGVVKQHRTIATYLNTLIEAGFAITHVEEWAPTPAQIAAEPKWVDERERPPFLIIAAQR
jgi:SAM-dependent methyltransferase